MQISVTIQNEQQIATKLQKIGQSLYDFSREMRETGQYLANYFSTVPFATLGRVYGNKWQDVTSATLAYKLKKYPQNAHNTLQRTGLLKSSFVFTSTKDGLALTNVAKSKDGYNYFLAHQNGGGNNPQRLIAAFNDQNKKVVLDIVTKAVQERVNLVS